MDKGLLAACQYSL